MHVANPKSTRANRSTAVSCEPIKNRVGSLPRHIASWSDADGDDDDDNEGGFYPFSCL